MKIARRVLALAFASFIVFVAGCDGFDFDPEPPFIPSPPPQFKPLSEKENLVFNLVLSYNRADITHYEELLHPDYTWYFQSADQARGLPVFWTREQDLNATKNMFLGARGQYADTAMFLDKLSLDITSGSWVPIDSIGGAPCNDCWMTARQYSLTCMLSGGSDGFAGYDLVQIIVMPVGDGAQKVYKIRRMQDIRIAGPD